MIGEVLFCIKESQKLTYKLT